MNVNEKKLFKLLVNKIKEDSKFKYYIAFTLGYKTPTTIDTWIRNGRVPQFQQMSLLKLLTDGETNDGKNSKTYWKQKA